MTREIPTLQHMWFSIRYTNYRGETSTRRISPISIRYGSSEWHPEPQWLMTAHEAERSVIREFAMKDMVPFHPTLADDA